MGVAYELFHIDTNLIRIALLLCRFYLMMSVSSRFRYLGRTNLFPGLRAFRPLRPKSQASASEDGHNFRFHTIRK